MLTPEMRQEVREIVSELLENHNPPVPKRLQDGYIESVQFALDGKAEKTHGHDLAEIRDRYPVLSQRISWDANQENITVEVTVQRIRGYAMCGALIGVSVQSVKADEANKSIHTDSQQFINGELLYKFTLPDSVRDAMPIRVMAFMRDLNDPEVEVRSGDRILSSGKLQEPVTNDQAQ